MVFASAPGSTLESLRAPAYLLPWAQLLVLPLLTGPEHAEHGAGATCRVVPEQP